MMHVPARAAQCITRRSPPLQGRSSSRFSQKFDLRAFAASTDAFPSPSVRTFAAASRTGGGPQAKRSPPSPVRLRLDTKVSASGSPDALFNEALEAIRSRRAELYRDRVGKHDFNESPAVTKLKSDELELTRKVFQRVDPDRDLTSDLQHPQHVFDPYWNPFQKLQTLKDQVTAEFDEYARYVSVAEAKRVRIEVKRSLRRSNPIYNPYSNDFRRFHGMEKGMEQPPKPFRLPDVHWEKTPLQSRIGKERITFRDVDIIQHCLAENGYILPRRTTMLSRPKQRDLVKAVKIAQQMSLIPYQRKVQDYQAMPLTDPLQWMVDRLTDRIVDSRDRRSRAMLQVMVERYPELNYRRFLAHESQRKQSHDESQEAPPI